MWVWPTVLTDDATGVERQAVVNASPARQRRRMCKRKGHIWMSKTDGAGNWIKMPCTRCGEPQPEDDQ